MCVEDESNECRFGFILHIIIDCFDNSKKNEVMFESTHANQLLQAPAFKKCTRTHACADIYSLFIVLRLHTTSPVRVIVCPQL